MKHKKESQQTVAKLSKPIPAPFSAYSRCAGILLHISSLPSHYGIGDFGETAYQFARFLQRSEQTVWQLLPLSSSSLSQGFSPYSSDGSFAGNVLLISPEQLMKEGLLSARDCLQSEVKTKKVDYKNVQKTKTVLLDKAYENFTKKPGNLKTDFAVFCNEEKDWLTDYALFRIIKIDQQGKSWNEWESSLKHRDKNALEAFANKHLEEMTKIKWQQFIFHKQWFALKEYCNSIGIKMFGDMPFYVAYDSADVWANQSLFKLDKNGKMIAEGGAPPDEFNTDGQSWGMPVYNWEAIKKEDYKWWLNRIKKSLVLFDLLRLDHFRGFSAYWEIPANAQSAKEGKWTPVAHQELFAHLQKQIGDLPLVAEDLGSIDEPVILLRNELHIPGMLILQFAFGNDMPQSEFIPHHYNKNAIVYTGNHDNNTTLGWFKSLPSNSVKNISRYVNQKVSNKNIVSVLKRLIYGSVAQLAILPMQDVLELDEEARMNSATNSDASWTWKLNDKWHSKTIEKQLKDLCFLYDRKKMK